MSTKITSLINKIKDTLIFDKHSSLRKKLSYILKNNDKKFYDYGEGYFYQSCEKIKVSGLRDTKFRINCLDLINLTENKEILDIGCNSGFFLIDLYNNYKIINSYCLSNTDTLNGYYNLYGDPLYINSKIFNYNLKLNSPALRSGNNNINLGININSINNIKYLN